MKIYYIDLNTFEICSEVYNFVTNLQFLLLELDEIYKYWSEDEDILKDILDDIKE